MQNLEFHQARTSDSKKVIITVSDLFSFTSHMLVRKQIIQQLILKKIQRWGWKSYWRSSSVFTDITFIDILLPFYSIIFLCLCHSDLPFNCLNRLTVYTAFINHFTSLYIVFNLPIGPYLAPHFNRLKCLFRFNTSVNSFVRWTYTSDFGPNS